MSALSGLSASSVLDQTKSASPSAFSALSSEQFVKIMFTELASQDPLKPNDSNQLLQQMSSLRDIESSLQMQTKLDALVGQNEFSSASLLIGAQVSGVTLDNRRVSGLVTSVLRTDEGPVVSLQSGERLLFKNVDQVAPPGVAPTSNGTGNNNGNGTGMGNGTGTGGTGTGTGGARASTSIDGAVRSALEALAAQQRARATTAGTTIVPEAGGSVDATVPGAQTGGPALD